ncbi:MAG: hypothetical protein C0432_02180 [Candidatus Puniceispirillum sp.]|nr:hypothetical protein [Candidatus Pelagibacter sp.]MBA4283083.1 hypothetical protein [Candidatus Puniceispirillum sp.]
MILYLKYLLQHNLQVITLNAILSISLFGLSYALFLNKFMTQEALLCIIFFFTVFHIYQTTRLFEEDIDDGSFDIACSLFGNMSCYIIARSVMLILCNGIILWGCFFTLSTMLRFHNVITFYYFLYTTHLFLFFISIQLLISITQFRIDALAIFTLNIPFFMPYYLNLMNLPLQNTQIYWAYGAVMIQLGIFFLISENLIFYRKQ